jgi:hypothetical protein
MRTGCGCGCVTVVLAAVAVSASLWFAWGVFDRPPTAYQVGSAAEGRRAQQKLFGVTTGTGRSTVTMSEGELNALLARHVSNDQMPVADAGVRLVGNGVAEITGRLPLHGLFGDSAGVVLRALPEGWARQPVWIQLRGQVRLEAGAARDARRRLRLDVDSMRIGRHRVPVAILTVLPEGPILRATRWPVPAAVDTVVIEPGRVIVATRP